MKFQLYHDVTRRTLSIPRAALQLSGLSDAEELTIHTGSGYVLTARSELSTGECLSLLDFLTSTASSLLLQLALHSRADEPCPDDVPDEIPDDEAHGLTVPLWLLEQAGLEAEECLEAFAEDGRVIVTGADDKRETAEDTAAHEEDDPLNAFPAGFRAMLRMAGVDLDTLRRHLRQEEAEDE